MGKNRVRIGFASRKKWIENFELDSLKMENKFDFATSARKKIINFRTVVVVQGDPKLCFPLPGRNGTGPSKTDHITF